LRRALKVTEGESRSDENERRGGSRLPSIFGQRSDLAAPVRRDCTPFRNSW
jgi:hypothetical protein